MASSEYEPGTCNIGGQERKRRRQMGYLSFGVAVVYIVGVLAAGYPETYLLGSFIFLYGGILGVLQARRRFCAAYGLAGQYGFDEDAGAVEDDTARSTDRTRALFIMGQALAGAVFLVSVIYGIAVSL